MEIDGSSDGLEDTDGFDEILGAALIDGLVNNSIYCVKVKTREARLVPKVSAH